MNKFLTLCTVVSLAFLSGCSDDDTTNSAASSNNDPSSSASTYSCDMQSTFVIGTVTSSSHSCYEVASTYATDAYRAYCTSSEGDGYSYVMTQGTGCASGYTLSCPTTDTTSGITLTTYYYGEEYANLDCTLSGN